MEDSSAADGLQDWEVLQDKVDDTVHSIGNSSDDNFDGVIRTDYFSLESHQKYVHPETLTSDPEFDTNNYGVKEEEGEGSDNPTWIDPSQTQFPSRGKKRERTNSSLSESDSSSSASSDCDPSSHSRIHSDCCQPITQFAFESQKAPPFVISKEEDEVGQLQIQPEPQSFELESFEKGQEQQQQQQQHSGDDQHFNSNSSDDGENKDVVVEEEKEDVKPPTLEKKSVSWWRVPLEVLRYCVLRVSPVWSLSVAAAALMGFYILGRRLYKMKRKSQGLQLKVTVDDKKVSQFMSRAARLNEAFSVVRRVPVIRPLLPAPPGLGQWPVMSLR